MRRIVMFQNVSVEGSFAAADGGLDWATQDPELDKLAASGTATSDTLLFGRRTYELFESFWPTAVTDEPTAPDPHGPGRSREIREIGVWINTATKLVFSTTRKEVTWQNSRLVRELDPRAIAELKRAPGKDMMIFGSGSIVAQLTRHELIDEYMLVLNPLLLGNGRPWLAGVPRSVKLSLVEARPLRSGNLLVRYTPASYLANPEAG